MRFEELERIVRARSRFTFVRSGGPGGQNVNKVSSKVVARFRLDALPGLNAEERGRLAARLGRRLTAGGELTLSVQETRDQARNRQIALRRLVELLAAALRKPRKRLRTKPTASSRESRLRAKRRRAASKRLRASRPEPE